MVIGQCVKVAAMKTVSRKLPFQLSLALFLLAGSTIVSARQERPLSSITYRLSMSRPQSHLFEVAIEVELPESAPESLDFQKWSPGRYAVFDFAKNVQEFRGRHLSTSVPLRQGQSSSYEGE